MHVSPVSRREFMQVAGLGMGSMLALSGQARAAGAGWMMRQNAVDTYFEWKRVTEGVHAAFGEGGNALLIVGPRDAALIDAKNAGYGETLFREANILAGAATLRLLINTHHHGDHTGGNPAFTAREGVVVMAHPKAVERIAAMSLDRAMNGANAALKTLEGSDKPAAKKVIEDVKKFVASSPTAKSFTPTRPFDVPAGQSRGLPIAGETLEIIHAGAGHTDNDLILMLKRHNVVHTGDLVFNNIWPYVDRSGGASIAGWIKSLEKLMDVCDDRTVVVPGHGEITNKKGVKAQLEFFQNVRGLAEAAVKEGKSKDEFLKVTPEEYKDFGKPEFRTITLGGVYDDVKDGPAEIKPTASPSPEKK